MIIELFCQCTWPFEKIPHIGDENCSYPPWLLLLGSSKNLTPRLARTGFSKSKEWSSILQLMVLLMLRSKQWAILLSKIGAQAYKVLQNLISPSIPSEKSFKELVEVMTKHFCPPPSEIQHKSKEARRVSSNLHH